MLRRAVLALVVLLLAISGTAASADSTQSGLGSTRGPGGGGGIPEVTPDGVIINGLVNILGDLRQFVSSDRSNNGATSDTPVEVDLGVVLDSIIDAEAFWTGNSRGLVGRGWVNTWVRPLGDAAAHTADAPMWIVFFLDSSVFDATPGAGEPVVTWGEWGRARQTVVKDCVDASGVADPDPCVLERGWEGDDRTVTVLNSMEAVRWRFRIADAETVVDTCAGMTATIVGDDSNNVIVGTPDADVIVAGAGNDTVDGLGGNDTICLGAGDDVANGGGGNDRIYGGGGADEIEGGKGRDKLYGQGGEDLLDGGPKKDKLFGGGAADELFGGGGNDVLKGQGGSDTGDGGNGSDRCVVETAVNCET